ncbi:hypothetical protein O6P43_011402 [Quillaja saponaria]|uniref:Uncharacterized protein n=1 Tax=Quillaja saponaria TaxID=32244 RepID=A0AAD7LZJ8_QUISA|nr:hypothetical protein O6P43_011402 [Quillaja saponaria]
MTATATNTKTCLHIRSNSLPSRPHPLISQFDEHLYRLNVSEATSSSIRHKLNGLQDLHDCINELLLLPFTQQALAQQCHEKWVDALLNGSLRLLDVCNAAKDALLRSKECIHDLQSVLRRRQHGENAFAAEGGKYMTSRKAVRKALKGINKESILSSSNKGSEALSTIGMLKQAEAVNFTSLEPLLLFISSIKKPLKWSSWSLFSTAMHPKRVGCDSEEKDIIEFEKVGASLRSLNCLKIGNIFQNQMENLGYIQELEEGLESLFRKLIKIGVSLLNILNH